MPGSSLEYVCLATHDLAPDFPACYRWLDGTVITDAQAADVRALRAHYVRQVAQRIRAGQGREPQRKALRLLRTYLSPSQQAQLDRDGAFLATTASGATYRLDARRGRTERVTRHGKRWFVLVRFCLHDDRAQPDAVMPPADMALAHLLLLHSGEDEFLGVANATVARDQLWNPAYLRNLRQARLERQP